MIEIPINNTSDSAKVEEIVNAILKSMSERNGWGATSVSSYGKETIKKALQKFKDKCYYTYYTERWDGTWITAWVYAQPTQWNNLHLNKTYQY